MYYLVEESQLGFTKEIMPENICPDKFKINKLRYGKERS